MAHHLVNSVIARCQQRLSPRESAGVCDVEVFDYYVCIFCSCAYFLCVSLG